jgi:hypothetical protein
MARKRQNNAGDAGNDDPITFENLDGSPDDEQMTDLVPPQGGDDDEPSEWQPPEEVEPRNSDMTEEGDLEDDGDDEEPEAEELETSEERKAADAPDEDVDEDLQDLPVEAQRKVMAERRKARDAQAEADKHRQSQHNAEIERAKSQEQTATNELEKQRQAYRDAVEEGDTDKQLQASEAIADLKYKLNQWSEYRTRLENSSPQPAQQSQPKGTTEEANRWLSRNKWFQDPQYQEHAQFARTVDKNLVAEGWDPASREYFDELERRMLRKYPDLPIHKAAGGQTTQKRKPKRSPVGAPDKGQATPRQSRGNKVVLTQEDRQNMRRFGLDPNDDATVRMYAQEKRKNERSSAGRS